MTYTNHIRAFFKKHAIASPDQMLIDTFEEIMAEELGIAKWIEERDMTFLMKVLAKAAEKTNAKPAPKKDKPAPKPSTPAAVQPTQPPLKMGGQP